MGDSNYLYWDSCIFLDGLRKTPVRKDHIERIETRAKAGDYHVFISTLAIAEVVKTKLYAPMTDDEVRVIDNYFRHKFLRTLPVDRIIARKAADLVRQHDIKPPDAIHLATALRANCSVFLTYDGDTSPVSGLLSLNGTVQSLAIKRPSDFITEGLFRT